MRAVTCGGRVVTDGPISFGDLDEQFAEQAARTVKGSGTHEDGPRSPEKVSGVSRPTLDDAKAFSDLLGAELDGARDVIERNWARTMEVMRAREGTKRFLKATANGTDWDSARRAVAKIQALPGGYPGDQDFGPTDEQTEAMVRIVARVIARARTRGRKETLESLDLDTDDCFDEVFDEVEE